MPRTMRYTDSRGRRQTLTWVQWVYLDSAGRGFERGWGGLDSTLVARLLEARGLAYLRDGWSYGPTAPRWRLIGRTALGEQVIERWRALAEAELR